MFDDPHGFHDSEGRPVGVFLWPDGTEVTMENSYFDIEVVDGVKRPRLRRKGYELDNVTMRREND